MYSVAFDLECKLIMPCVITNKARRDLIKLDRSIWLCFQKSDIPQKIFIVDDIHFRGLEVTKHTGTMQSEN